MPPVHVSSMRSLLPLGVAAAVSFMISATTAAADSGVAVPEQRDFYLRAALSINWSRKARFTDKDCLSTSPAALYGCGEGLDGAPTQSRGDFGTMGGVEVGVGHIVSPRLRAEVVLQYRQSFAFEGLANFGSLSRTDRREVSVGVSSLSAMLSGYLDLPEFGVPRIGPFSPFVGGGIGVSRVETGDTHMEFPNTRTIVPGGNRANLAWMLAAGVALSTDERTTLELAWRYTDLGNAETGRGAGRVVWRDASREPLPLDLARTRAKLRTHRLILSMRYAF